MGDPTAQGFSLTPDEEKFFARFLRQRALPLSAAVSAIAGGLTAAVLSCAIAPAAGTPSVHSEFDFSELARPAADEQARAELVVLRKELAALRERPAAENAAAPPAPRDGRDVEALRRELESLRRELRILATSVSALEGRPSAAVPASIDGAAPADLEPLRKRLYNVEARQDREETSRLEWAGSVEQRVRNLELARKTRETEQQAAVQSILDRLHELESAQAR